MVISVGVVGVVRVAADDQRDEQTKQPDNNADTKASAKCDADNFARRKSRPHVFRANLIHTIAAFAPAIGGVTARLTAGRNAERGV